MTKREEKLQPAQDPQPLHDDEVEDDFDADEFHGDEFNGEDFNADDFNGEDIEGFDGGCDAASFGDFDPMQALGQLLVTQEGETIPDVLTGIRQSLDTLTKVLHKISKQLDKK